MKDLIEALTIFLRYVEEGSYEANYPTNCSHDTLWVNVDPSLVSDKDKKRLDELGFFVSEEDDRGFTSFRFGSC